jgi:hypothetical protein
VPSGKGFGLIGAILALLSILPFALPFDFLPHSWDSTIYSIISFGMLPTSIVAGIIASLRHNRYWLLLSLGGAAYEIVLLTAVAV